MRLTVFATLLGSLLLPLLPAPILAATPPAADRSIRATQAVVEVINWRQYSYLDQVIWVVGEIRNASESSLAHPVVTATFDDQSGQVVAEASAEADASLLGPGGITTFRVTLRPPGSAVRVVALNINGVPTDSRPPSGAFISDRRAQYQEIDEDRLFTRDNCDPEHADCYYSERVKVRTDNYLIEGAITNGGDVPLTNVRVSAALYDQDGRVVNTWVEPVEATVFRAGEVAGFRLLVYWAPGVRAYTLRVFADPLGA